MPESDISVQEIKPARHSPKKTRSPQMGFEITDGDFSIPPTIIETSSAPSAFERISNRLVWQEAKLGDNCVFFDLGEKLSEDKEHVGTLFNGNNWQSGGEASIESSSQKPRVKSPKFDAVVIHVNDFSKCRNQLDSLLENVRSRMGYNKPIYISIERQAGLDIEQLKLELSQMVHDAHFITPHILVGRKGKNEDILFETRTKVKRHNVLPDFLKDAEIDETELEAARLKPKTPGEIKRERFAFAIHHPDKLIPSGEQCFHCRDPLYFISHAKPNEENPDGDYVRVMYRWCLKDGQRGKEIPLKS